MFVWLAVLTATALPLPLALSLPVDRVGSEAPTFTRSLGRPTSMDLLFALQGFGVDGVFAVCIMLLLAQELPLDLAVMSGASLLAVRHVCDAVGAPRRIAPTPMSTCTSRAGARAIRSFGRRPASRGALAAAVRAGEQP